ncbi:MAG TPA: hypothetical protein VGR25_02100 [bacterium]|nr:hypothetical protein [bacterium]
MKGQELSEEIDLYNKRFTLRFTDRPELQRVEVAVLEGSGQQARPLVPHPVRGRNRTDARDRALTALHNYAGMDRYLGLVRRVAEELAPGSRLEVDEDAAEIRVELVGARRLRMPLTLVREDALDPDRTEEELIGFIRAHFDGYLEEGR